MNNGYIQYIKEKERAESYRLARESFNKVFGDRKQGETSFCGKRSSLTTCTPDKKQLDHQLKSHFW